MALALGPDGGSEALVWDTIEDLITAYHDTSHSPLTEIEKQALLPYAAAVPLYFAALAGFSRDPVAQLRSRLEFLELSHRLLACVGLA